VKRGVVERDFDVSGVTGTGQICTFVVNDDGRVVIFWPVGEGIWPSLEEAIKVHGHNGNTRFVLLDDDEASHCNSCHFFLSRGNGMTCDFHKNECPGCMAGVST